jgi:outer membrane protein OmpA-like peptidoglycan-associated protein
MSLRTPVLMAIILAFGLSACATDQKMTRTQKGTLIGATTGAIIGGLTTKDKNKRGKRVLLGAVGGGLTGAAVGSYMDKQRQELEKALAAEKQAGAINIEKLQNHVVRVTMTDQTAFDVDSAQIKPGFTTTMNKISNIVNTYGKTSLTIVGHTDNTGTTSHNQGLSERRALSVAQYFTNRGVVPERLGAEGRGESAPRASNASATGRQQNRRVEVYIEPIVASQES